MSQSTTDWTDEVSVTYSPDGTLSDAVFDALDTAVIPLDQTSQTLYDVVDLDALDRLFDPSGGLDSLAIGVTVFDCRVTIYGSGLVRVTRLAT